MTDPRMSRRAVLRGAVGGLSIGLALPFMPSWAARLGAEEPGAGAPPPIRFAGFYQANGVPPDHWNLGYGEGPITELSQNLKSLAAIKDDVVVLRGFWHRETRGGDGHYFKESPWLTGTGITKTTGADLNSGGVSLDQILAQQVGFQTRLPSIELSCERVSSGVDTNVGVTRVYGGHISWSTPSTPVPRETDPYQAFQRLFEITPVRTGAKGITQLDEVNLIDVVSQHGRMVKNEVATDDKRKVDEYLDTVRDIEQRLKGEIQRAAKPRVMTPGQKAAIEQLKKDAQSYAGAYVRGDHTDLVTVMMDIMAMAFWTDNTRVGTLMYGNAVSGRNFSFLDGVNSSHHETSHHDESEGLKSQYSKIATWHADRFTQFVERLKGLPEGEGTTLLDHTIVLQGSGLGDGNRHSNRDLPLLLAGGKAAGIKGGRQVVSKGDDEPMCNVLKEVGERAGAQLKDFGDASGGLDRLGA